MEQTTKLSLVIKAFGDLENRTNFHELEEVLWIFMDYPTNSINHMKEKCLDGYFIIHSSSSKIGEGATIISSFIGFFKEYFNKIFLNGIGV